MGIPWEKSTVRGSWRDGLSSAPALKIHSVSGMLCLDVKVSVPPIVTPHSPRFIEYADPAAGIGNPTLLRYST